MIVLNILYALIGITIIVFVHEAGHFLAAKKVGVRVERFSLGFDPPFRGRNLRLFSFKWHGTEYVIGVIPFGGYVKLAGGEVLSEPGKKPAEGDLLAKSVGARALVFVAGSAMNIISAFFFFMLAFSLGVSFPDSKVGAVATGTPAWEAGIEPGDRILEVNGETVMDFIEMKYAVALARRSEPIYVKVERPRISAPPEVRQFTITPRWDPELGFNDVGISAAYSDIVAQAAPKSALETLGLRPGDRILGLDLRGEKILDLPFNSLLETLRDFNLLYPREGFQLLVLREGKETWIDVRPPAPEKGKARPQIGVVQGRGNVARAFAPGSKAGTVLRRGEQVLRIDGEAVANVDWPLILEKRSGGKLSLEVRSPAGERRSVEVEREEFLRWNLRGEIRWDSYALTVAAIKPGSPLADAGLREGDTITELAGESCYSPKEIQDILSRHPPAADSGQVTLRAFRGEDPIDLSADRTALMDKTGVTWRTMPPLAAVLPEGPAALAGMTVGCLLVKLGDKQIHSWEEMQEEVARTKVGDRLGVAWRAPDGTEKSATLTIGVDTLKPFEFPVEMVQTTIKTGLLDSVVVGARRTLVNTKQIILVLRSLIRRDVSAKNMAGPVGIVHQITVVLEQGQLAMLIYWLAYISVNLGLLNLFPFPILDGGHLFFLLIEKLKGSPVDVRVQEWAMNIAFLLILFLAFFVTFNDLKRLFP